jgi:hypothetical protein
MLIRIYRDPNSDAGGAASAATSTGAVPASTPAGGGQAPASPGARIQSFAEGLAKSLQKAPTPSLPADGGKQTDKAATLPEGEGGDKDKSKEPGTTAESEIEADPDEEQEGAEPEKEWSKEELKTLEAMKAKLPFTPESRTVLKSLRDTRAQLDRVSASNTNAISRAQSLEAALYAGDAKALQEMGFDLKLDQRKPDDMIKELEADFNAIKETMEPVIRDLAAQDPDVAKKVTKALQKVLGRYNDRAATITREQEWQERESKILAKAGVKSEDPNNYKKLSEKAQSNLSALSQEDPEAAKYFKFIESETKPGGGLHALGLNLARAYGTSLEAARTMNKMAKGLYFEQNMKAILADKRKAWEKDREKRSQTARPGGASAAPPATQNGIHSRLAAGMSAYMGRR